MSYGLLWIETLLACLLFAAILTTIGLRRKSRKTIVVAVCGLGILLPLVPLGVLVAYTAALRFAAGIRNSSFLWALVLVICYLGGATAAVRIATRRDEAGVRHAFSWPLGRLATAWLVVMSLIAMTFWNMDLQAQMEIQSLRAEAGALALGVAPPPIADAVNAAPLYRLADERLRTATAPVDGDRDYSELDARSPEVAAYLQRQQKTLAIVRRAADLPECRFEYDYSKPDIELVLRELGALRNGARLLAIAAKAEAAAGNTDLALADCRRMYAIGGHAGSSPLLVSGLVAIGVDALASKTVAQILPGVTTATQLDPLPVPDPQAVARRFAHTLRGEEAMGLAFYCDIAGGKSVPGVVAASSMNHLPPLGTSGRAGTAWSRSSGLILWLTWLQDDVGTYRELMQRVHESSQRPYHEFAAELQAKVGKRYGLLTSLLVPSMLASLRNVAETQALRSAVGVAIAATRYRVDHGDYPPSADRLVPEYLDAIPLDPFNGQPLRFKKTSDGSVVIYSVGSDGVDDGGQVEKPRDGKHPADVGIILTLPPGR
jgi:hypothetical protein